MNAPDITHLPTSVELNVKRTRMTGTGPETDSRQIDPVEQWQLEQLLVEVQTREENLRAYEAHLRAWQERIDATRPVTSGRNPSGHPFAPSLPREDPALLAAWEKLHRARELQEAEHKHLIEDRLLLQEREAALKKREASLALREERLAARERAPAPVEQKKAPATMASFTRTHFTMAKSVFGAKG
jgi:hypothetical protein